MCPETTSIGAYLLGALEPQERVELERHLGGCEICRQELIEVAHLPGLMQRLTLDEVTRGAPGRDPHAESRPDLVSGSDLARPSAEPATVAPSSWSPVVHRLSRSPMLQLTMIVVLVLVTAGVASAELLTGEPSAAVATWTSTDATGGIDTVARLAHQPWGTDIRLSMEDLPPGLTCRLVVHPRTGAAETAGSWSTNYEVRLTVLGSTSIPLSQIDRIDVIRSDEVVLATLTNTTR